MVSLAFAGRGVQLGAIGIGVVHLTSDSEAFVPSRAGVAFARASIVVDTDWLTRPLCAGRVGVAMRVEAGSSVYKGHKMVLCAASMHILQGLLWARFHSIG